MTVCIAALGTFEVKGQPVEAVVLASDRMVTLGSFIEFEHEIPKLTMINGNTAVMIAGDAIAGSEIRDEVTQRVSKQPTMSQGEIASTVGAAYYSHRMQVAESLDAARVPIDLLTLVEDKTRGNLSENESREIEEALYQLRMLFVERSSGTES